MNKSELEIKPFVKWPGGKTKHKNRINNLIRYIDLNNATYFEPFIGGGSMLFSISPKKAVINDLNSDLIITYKVVQDKPLDLMKRLDFHKKNYEINPKEYFYQVRSMDRDVEYSTLPEVEKAARLIFLNKTCFNGLYRVNKNGYFNTPIGKYIDPKLYDENNILGVSQYLKSSSIKMYDEDYKEILKKAKKNDLIYLDPPYDYDDNKIFLNYGRNDFGKKDLKDLQEISYDLLKKGCYVVISNNYTKYVKELFLDPFNKEETHFKYELFDVKRLLNSKVEQRSKPVKEILLYGSNIPTGWWLK